MIRAGSRRAIEEEGESAFVSMTDMTVSFLFIVMLLLAFFASQYDPEQKVPLIDYETVVAERDALLAQLEALRLERDAIAAERDALMVLNAGLQREVDRLTAEVLRLTSSRDGLRRDLTQREADLATVTAARDAAVQEVERLRARLNAMEAERDATETSLAELRASLDALRDRLRELLDTLAARDARIAELEARVAALDLEVAELTAEIALLRQPDPLESYINASLGQRRRLLEILRDSLRIDYPDIDIVISEQSDALRFQGDGLFRSGSSTIRPDRRDLIRDVAVRLDQLLPCYTLGDEAAFAVGCNPGFAVIEAVQIEGHTDAVGSDENNLALSAQRAIATFIEMTRTEAGLTGHRNLAGQPVLSIAGYGESRPVADNLEDLGRSTNRRIDLRFIMHVPRQSEEIETIRLRLLGDGTGEGAR